MLWRGPPGVFEDEVRSRLLAPSAELILDALPPLSPQTRFLEVQAGGAVLSRALVERIAGLGRLVAIDDDTALAGGLPLTARRAARAVAGFPALPFKDACFDVAIANLVIGDDDDALRLAELRRIVRPGGWLLVTVIAHGSFARLFDVVSDIADDRKDVVVAGAVNAARDRLPDLATVQQRVREAGFTMAHIGTEERLLGLFRSAELVADPLITEVILGTVLENAVPASLLPAIGQAVDGWYPDGLPLVVNTMVIAARPDRRSEIPTVKAD